MKSIIAIFIGAGLGALLRWWLSLTLNNYFPSIPPGTLAANLSGGYIIGVGVAFFASFSVLPPERRLFVITGFCGGLITFSTFFPITPWKTSRNAGHGIQAALRASLSLAGLKASVSRGEI